MPQFWAMLLRGVAKKTKRIYWCVRHSINTSFKFNWSVIYFFVFRFSYFAREFIEKIPEKRLISQKMDCIHNMVKTKLFEDQGTMYTHI